MYCISVLLNRSTKRHLGVFINVPQKNQNVTLQTDLISTAYKEVIINLKQVFTVNKCSQNCHHIPVNVRLVMDEVTVMQFYDLDQVWNSIYNLVLVLC